MDNKYFTISINNHILELNWPAPELKRAPALNIDSCKELLEVLDMAKKHDRVHGLIWKGTHPRFFCTGGDLSEYAELKNAAAGKAIHQKIAKTIEALAALPFPTVALVNGDTWGGGVELISAFDHIISVPHAMFGLWQRRVGLTWGWGGYTRLNERISGKILRQLALEARAICASEALRIGLIDEIKASEQLLEYGRNWIQRQISLPQNPAAAIKNINSKNERLEFEKLWWRDEHRTILASWSSK